MDWIYLSPHLDDVAFSCGGLIWKQVHSGQMVQIWTICAGDPPADVLSPLAEMLHARWNTGKETVDKRRIEDQVACIHLGASIRHFNFPDCIYRTDGRIFLYDSETALCGNLHPADMSLIQRLTSEIEANLPMSAQLVSPLALGNHVDHQLVRRAAELLQENLGIQMMYYADYPYASQHGEQLREMQAQWEEERVYPISSQGLAAWQDAMAAYSSQISTFWQDEGQMRTAVESYCQQMGGIHLWCKRVGSNKPVDSGYESSKL